MRFLLFCLTVCSATQALWAAPRDARHEAIDRALNFLYRTASDDASFARYGADLLWCFFSVAHTDSDGRLRRSALQMGHRFALRWRDTHRHLPPTATPEQIYLTLEGSYAAERLGVPDAQLKAELRRAVPRFKAVDYLRFDPLRGPPALDDPRRYGIFCDTLIHSYFGDAFGIPIGVHYVDVVRWLPRMRPYEGLDEDTEFEAFYAVTHVIYTLDHYSERRISRSLLPLEFSFLRRKLKQAIADDDPEMVGEALDCLKAAGFAGDPDVRAGERYLISAQRADGSWAGDQDDPYTAYHSAWTGLDGLRDYRFHGAVTRIPAP